MNIRSRWRSSALLLTLLPACTPEAPCPRSGSLELLEAVDAQDKANDEARAIASGWGAEQGADAALVARVAQAIDQQAGAFLFWEGLWVAEPRYSAVADRLVARQLPDALAVIPFALTGYLDAGTGTDCRTGAWLLPPTASGVRVAGCRLRGRAELWSPPGEPEGGLYDDANGCRVAWCDLDERRTFANATDAALATIEATWRSTPDAPGKLEAQLTSETGRDPALPVAWHLLATCFYGGTDKTAAHWRPRPAWCGAAPHIDYARVSRCAAQPPTATP